MSSEDTRPNSKNHFPEQGAPEVPITTEAGSPTGQEGIIPLPTPQTPLKLPSDPTERSYLSGIDQLLFLLTLVFAFILSSFSIRNTDVYQQLSVGKLIAKGEYQFGQDPFSWTSQPLSWANDWTGEKIVWVNHSWLFGFFTYSLYSIDSSGALMVVVKAILVMLAIGLIILAGRQIGRSLFIPTLCAALAALVMSPRLLYQPIILSITLEALTIYLLERPRLCKEADPSKSGKGSWFLLPLVFAFWVNVDQWFILGPITVALYWVGSIVHSVLGPRGNESKADSPLLLSFILFACILACLINPYHIHAFTIPEQLGFSSAAETVMNDRQVLTYFASPFKLGGNYFSTSLGISVAGLSYFVMILVGVASFVAVGVMNGSQFRWERLFVFAFMTVISGLSARVIPLMAVATAPIIALNFLDSTSKAAQNQFFSPSTLQSMLALRTLALLVLTLLGAASAVGLTQAKPQIIRRLGFQMIPDSSKKALAEKVASLRKENALPANIHWFSTQIDLTNYFSWFCPGEKISFDQRFNIYSDSAEDFKKVRDALVDLKPLPPGTEPAWREVFRRNKTRFLLANEDEILTRPILLEKILGNPQEWTLLFLDGRSLLVVWNDPALRSTEQAKAESYAKLQWSSEKEAFGPHALVADPSGPEREPRERAWIDEIWDPAPVMPTEAFQGKACGIYFRSRIPADFERLMQTINIDIGKQILSLGSLRANPEFTFPQLGVALASQLRLLVSLNDLAYNRRSPPVPGRQQDIQPMDLEARQILEFRFNNGEMGPQGALYVALRSIRKALFNSPDDARLYNLLGDTYLQIGRNTQERSLTGDNQLLTSIREIQAMAAYYQASKLDPDNSDYHARLADLYYEGGYFDLAAKERREQVRSLKLLQASNPEMQKTFEREIDSLDRNVKSAEENLKNNYENPYLVQASDKEDWLEKAAIAMSPKRPTPWLCRRPVTKQFGLVEKALEALRQVPGTQLIIKGPMGPESPALVAQVDLLLRLGRLKDSGEVLFPNGTDSLRKLLGPHRGMRMSRDERFLLPAFEALQVCLAAAKGNPQQTDQAMEELIQVTCGPDKMKGLSTQVAGNLGQVLLDEAFRASRFGPNLNLTIIKSNSLIQDSFLITLQQASLEADLLTIRGWLALETGYIEKAKKYLEQAENLITQYKAQRLEYSLQGLARTGLRWIQENQ